jgi:hypothetical protein
MNISDNKIDQALFRKHLAVGVFRFRHAISEKDQQVARRKIHAALVVYSKGKGSHHHAIHLETCEASVSNQDGREVAGVGVGEGAGSIIVNAEKEGGVLFRRRIDIQLLVQVGDDCGGGDALAGLALSGRRRKLNRASQLSTER